MITDEWREEIHLFRCHGDRLLGIATCPHKMTETGVLIVVGGPQYRSGSHRQFTLLARQLADRGIPSYRFDYRGMGDSEGPKQCFTTINDDIKAAIDSFTEHHPEIKSIVIWGLCDAASAALLYVNSDPRVKGLVLLNPWVQIGGLSAKVKFSHYYFPRLVTREFWKKVFSREMEFSSAIREFFDAIKQSNTHQENPNTPVEPSSYVEKMLAALTSYKGEVLIILSGNDFTAQEFITLTSTDRRWNNAIRAKQVTSKTLAGASHTFSTKTWRDTVADWTITWLLQLENKLKTSSS